MSAPFTYFRGGVLSLFLFEFPWFTENLCSVRFLTEKSSCLLDGTGFTGNFSSMPASWCDLFSGCGVC